MGIVFGKGIPPAYGPSDPLTIIISQTPYCFFSGDLGVTISTGVSAWADQTSNGYNAVQGTGTAQPTIATNLNGRNSLVFDGTDDRLVVGTMNLPPPGTTPTYVFAVLRVLTDATNSSIWGGGSSTLMRCFRASTNVYRLNNGTNGGLTSAITPSTWYKVQATYQNTTSDYISFGSSITGTGTAVGNGDSAAGAFTIGAQQSAGTNPANIEIACFGIWNGEPTSGEKTAIDTWISSYYGGSVGV